MSKVIEFDEQCKSCGGTGVYVGFAEHHGAGVVCATCKGTGCHHVRLEYEDFTGRKEREGITRVLEVNPGVAVGNTIGGLELFGGMSYEDWKQGKPFPPGSEMREFTCPAWWYQCADYTKKPQWDQCTSSWGGTFSTCREFCNKAECWERWDKEFGRKESE